MKNKRIPTGETTEHPFPVNPTYPRVAEPANDEEAKDTQSTYVSYLRSGQWYLIFIGAGALIGGALFYEAFVRHPERYMLPIAYYSAPSHKEYLQIDHVIYLEVAIDGRSMGRIHIGLFDGEAPHFCENLHRLATGNNPEGRTLKGTLFWKSTGACLYGGDMKGIDGKDGILALDAPYLPEDTHNTVSFPFGCYAAGGFTHQVRNANDSNFLIMMDEGRVAAKGDYTCFGMVLKGFNLVDQISRLPRKPFPYFVDRVEVIDCGLSPLDGNREAIDKTLKRFHKARLQRFLATNYYHKKKNEEELVEKQRRDKMKDKRDQVAAELELVAQSSNSS